MELKEMFYITEKDWYKLQAWAKLAYDEDKNEISGLMTAIPQKDGRYKIGDVEILKQENSGTNTELDGEAVTEYKMKYAMKYKDKRMKYVWWHSHHTMGAFWSGTDENEINAWENESFSLALVINLREEYVFRVSLWKASGLPIKEHYDIDLTIERKQPKISITESMKKKYEELCADRVSHVNTYTGYRRNGWGQIQGRLFAKNEVALNIETAYGQLIDEIEKIFDGISDGSIKVKEYKKKIKKLSKTCSENKLPFKPILFKGQMHEILEQVMSSLAGDAIEWTDITYKESIEDTHNYNQGWGRYGY
tara:strand:- start:5921 stop:6841 length:921 start_codon:yes stop_codon:yes gene_type:complete